MRSLINQFMAAVLGDEAATALKKAADQSTSIETVLGPRAILSWLNVISRWDYDGQVPGMPGSYLAFSKSEGGFTGELRWGKHTYDFEAQDITHIAAALSCALEVDQPVAKNLRDGDLLSLGENIDLLVKTNLLKTDWPDVDADDIECPVCGVKGCETRHVKRNGEWTVEESPDEEHDAKKFEAPGGHATQKPPAGFQAPQSQTAKAPARNKKRGFQVGIGKSQARTKCSVCDAPQFSGDVFVGCFCLRDLAKHAEAEAAGDGYHIVFGPEWTKQDISVFMDIVGGEA